MKKTKILVSFVLFCIVLSFFSIAFAGSAKIKYSVEYGNVMTYRKHIITLGTNAKELVSYNEFIKENSDPSSTIYQIADGTLSGYGQCRLKITYGNDVTFKSGFVNGTDFYEKKDDQEDPTNPDNYWTDYQYEFYSDLDENDYDLFHNNSLYYLAETILGQKPQWDKILNFYKYLKEGNAPNVKLCLEFDGCSESVKVPLSCDDPNTIFYQLTGIEYTLDESIDLIDDLMGEGSEAAEHANHLSGSSTDDINPFEKYFVKLLLALGDFFSNLLGDIVGGDVTIFKIIFNGASNISIPSLNPNLFNPANRSTFGNVDIGQIISDWYNVFRGLAFVFYIISLLAVGIHVMLNSTAQGMQKAKSLMVEWLKGILMLVFMPTVIKYLFEINDSFIEIIYDTATHGSTNIQMSTNYAAYTDGSEWSATAIEFRSPEFVSRYTGSMTFGSDEANAAYMNNIVEYRENYDLTRICRAYAGATYRIGYCFIWYILLGQLLVFIVIYYKRYFTILFLIAAFPIICIFHAVSVMKGMNKGPEITNWFKKLVENVFIQAIHCVIFVLITAICLNIFQEAVKSNNGGINWILLIISINFIPEGEKILKRILNSIGGSGGGMADASKGIKGFLGRASDSARKLIGRPPKEG